MSLRLRGVSESWSREIEGLSGVSCRASYGGAGEAAHGEEREQLHGEGSRMQSNETQRSQQAGSLRLNARTGACASFTSLAFEDSIVECNCDTRGTVQHTSRPGEEDEGELSGGDVTRDDNIGGGVLVI